MAKTGRGSTTTTPSHAEVTPTRERIVQAAADAFMRQGLPGTGLKQISAESAAPFGSLYHFFPGGKEELAAETLRWAGAAYRDLVAAVWDAAPDPVTAVHDVFEGAAATLRGSDYADACPIATVALEVASTNDALRGVTAVIFADWLDALATRLRAVGITAARARELATVVVAALEGGFLLSRAARSTDAMDAIGRSMVALVAAEVDAAVDDASPGAHRARRPRTRRAAKGG
jgi:AcrR family transcriptional regulator